MTNVYETPNSDISTDQALANPPLFSASGRVGRLRFLAHVNWITAVFSLIGGFAMVLLAMISESLFLVGNALLVAASLWVLFIFAIKRSHDFDVSGWLSLLVLIPLVNLVFIFMPGNKTANRFGPVPTPNSIWLWLGGLLLPFVFIVGILAAIAIPAYQSYTTRAMVGSGFFASSEAKTTVAEYYRTNGRYPDASTLAQLGFDQPRVEQYASVKIEPDTGVIVITMCPASDCPQEIDGRSFFFVPQDANGELSFACVNEEIDDRFMPGSCRGS